MSQVHVRVFPLIPGLLISSIKAKTDLFPVLDALGSQSLFLFRSRKYSVTPNSRIG